jgi:AcrR family transcriptional regulator
MNEDSPPQLSKRARTRERLIAVANDLFLEKGVHRTSLQDIAARAGVTKGAIYSSFQSKEELVAAVIAETVIALRPVLSPGMAIEQILAALGAAAISMMPEVKARASLVAEYNLYALSHERLRSLMEVNHAKAYEDALAEVERILPSNLSMSPRQIVITLQALTVGFFQQRTLYPSLFTDDDVMAAFRAIGSALNVRSPLLNSEGT